MIIIYCEVTEVQTEADDLIIKYKNSPSVSFTLSELYFFVL